MGKIYDALKKAQEDSLNQQRKNTVEVTTDQRETHNSIKDNPLRANTIVTQAVPRKTKIDQVFSGEKSAESYNKTLAEKLFLDQQTHSVLGEQFKKLRSYILRLNKNASMRSILITSSIPAEGKTTVASNLAISIAQGMDEHVLLVNSDLRKPSIDNLFDMQSSYGLADFLGNNYTIANIVHKTCFKKLSVIPCGSIPENPSELIASKKMSQFLQETKDRYQDRFIIIDTTPVEQTPEPQLLAEQVDGILLVVRAGMTDRQIIKKTVDTLGKDKIIGIIFNFSNEKTTSSYDYYYSNQEKGKNQN